MDDDFMSVDEFSRWLEEFDVVIFNFWRESFKANRSCSTIFGYNYEEVFDGYSANDWIPLKKYIEKNKELVWIQMI